MAEAMNASQQIEQHIAGITDWRGEVLARIRKIIREADPAIIEEWKWMGTPVWSRDGMIAVANAFKSKVNVTFAYGAHLPDPHKLFNSGFGGNTRRAIDIFAGDKIDEPSLTALVLAGIEYNRTHLKKNAPKVSRAKATEIKEG
jgi:hypothetical protein